MDREESWQVIAAERRSIADLLAGLSADEWETPSLCAAWRVRDVAAHLAMAPQAPTAPSMLTESTRARGSLDALNHDIAVRHAERPSGRIVDELRQIADSRRLPVATGLPDQPLRRPRARAGHRDPARVDRAPCLWGPPRPPPNASGRRAGRSGPGGACAGSGSRRPMSTGPSGGRGRTGLDRGPAPGAHRPDGGRPRPAPRPGRGGARRPLRPLAEGGSGVMGCLRAGARPRRARRSVKPRPRGWLTQWPGRSRAGGAGRRGDPRCLAGHRGRAGPRGRDRRRHRPRRPGARTVRSRPAGDGGGPRRRAAWRLGDGGAARPDHLDQTRPVTLVSADDA